MLRFIVDNNRSVVLLTYYCCATVIYRFMIPSLVRIYVSLAIVYESRWISREEES